METGVDQEVHATAGREASATISSSVGRYSFTAGEVVMPMRDYIERAHE